MRVAYLSPLPPSRSGIADYSAELIPFLSQHVELELFTDDPDPSREWLAGELPLGSIEDFLRRPDSFDMALYHLGNNPDYHASILQALLTHPGVVVLHEYMLHHLFQGMTLSRNDVAGYVEEMRYCYGPTGQSLAERHLGTGVPIDAWRYPLFERVVDRSLGLLVHNESTRHRIEASRPDSLIEVVPHHLALDRLPPGDGSELRRRFDIPADAFLVASFGFMTPHKRLDVSLKAFAELHREMPESRYMLAGEVSPFFDLDMLLEPDLASGVVVTGRLALEDLLAAMRACDVAVNLRFPSGGETSGTLMRLLGMGKPVIVSNHGSFSEVPDGCCVKLDIDDQEPLMLLEYLRRLASDDDLRSSLGHNAARHMAREHTLAGSALGYARLLERVDHAKPDLFPARPPLTVDVAPTMYGELVSELGSAASDIGLQDRAGEELSELARCLVELDLDGWTSGTGAKR